MKDKLAAETIAQFANIRKTSQSTSLLRAKTEHWAAQVLSLIFPEFSLVIDTDNASVDRDIHEIWRKFQILEDLIGFNNLTLQQGAEALLEIREVLMEDAQAAFDGDPAAQSIDEVILAYPGFRALAFFRVANFLYRRGYPLIPRIITERGHHETGIDIHPGATIGPRCFIDHGTGVVIGQTAIVGSNVKIYQGVTLGALSVSKELANIKRHPTVEDGVVIYANSTILGGETVIGANSIIGGNSWLTSSVPPDSFVKRQP